MTNLDSLKLCGHHFISLVVPKNCETTILAELFNMYLKESCFPNCWKVLSFKILGFSFSPKLDWGSYIMSIAKATSKKIGSSICSMSFLSPDIAGYLHESSIWRCMEYFCHVYAGAPSCFLEMLDKVQKWIYRTDGPSLAASLERLGHC